MPATSSAPSTRAVRWRCTPCAAELGDEKFDELLLSWIEEHSGQSASWADFESLVTTIAGRDETAFLQAWFHSTTVPADEFLYPGDLTP